MTSLLIFLCFSIVSLSTQSFSVYRLMPKSLTDFQAIQKLYKNATDHDLNFWKTGKDKHGFWDVMVEKKNENFLMDYFHNNGNISHIRTIDDVEKLISKHENNQTLSKMFPRLWDDSSSGHYDFHTYGSYQRMTDWMKQLVVKYPKMVQYISIGKTTEGRNIDEWAAPHTALFFIHQLTSRANEPGIKKLLEEITFVVVPCLNPDGYEFTRSSTNPHVRLWRKNRSKMQCRQDIWGRNRCCRGVDLNRNFDFHFRESGTSDDPCSEIYQGPAPFSEPEAKAYEVGKKAAQALKRVYGTKYVVGSGADTLYPASGGSEDWAKHEAKVKFVYLLELRPDEKNWDGFILDEKELIPTARETWEGVRVVAEAVLDRIVAAKATTPKEAPKARGFRFGDGTEGSCFDVRHACKRWVQEREELCRTVPIFMRENCAYSCNFC
ncbi:Protein CBG05160 [Caenorhabditis briggsae]|uniref:Protein CBG05160 n=1 Tax=Caenorhabditis briggsae TaxID=6238 RepID=A8WZ49_CAEBR|nr:Protein CBG05160 [Caenorhabditis briggsae]CAP25659.2 Protein CBG05160 [Caenorhabditis briggsae]